MDFERGTQLKGYIQREVREHPMHSNYGYTYYFTRFFLERLFNIAPEKFILKGSNAQFVNLKKLVRPITDIDLATQYSMESVNNIILELMLKNSNTKFSIKQRFVTTNATINYRIMCQLDNIQHLVTLDLRKESQLESTQQKIPILFSKDREFNVNTISIEEHLANKIYITILNIYLNQKLGKEFRRFKDFYDIYKILSIKAIDEAKVAHLVNQKIEQDDFLRTYQIRGNLFNNQFVKENMEKWNVDKKEYEFDQNVSFEQTVDATNTIVSKIK